VTQMRCRLAVNLVHLQGVETIRTGNISETRTIDGITGGEICGIDAAHRALVNVLHTLKELVEAEADPSVVTRSLHHFVLQAESHIEDEGLIMQWYSFPHASGHVSVHARMFESVMATHERFAHDPSSLRPEFIEELRMWLVHHISTDDRAYAEYIARRGRPQPLHCVSGSYATPPCLQCAHVLCDGRFGEARPWPAIQRQLER